MSISFTWVTIFCLWLWNFYPRSDLIYIKIYKKQAGYYTLCKIYIKNSCLRFPFRLTLIELECQSGGALMLVYGKCRDGFQLIMYEEAAVAERTIEWRSELHQHRLGSACWTTGAAAYRSSGERRLSLICCNVFLWGSWDDSK